MFRCAFLAGLFLAAVEVAGGVVPQANDPIGQLSKLRIDQSQVYSVRDITLRRDVLSISLNRGTLAFTESVAGKVTGAVFIGSGEILAIPPDRVERGQLFRFTKSALLNEPFEAAVFRFTDATHEEILKEIRGRAVEDVTSDERNEILRWDSELQRRGRYLNGRILADLLGPADKPFFLAQIEGRELGWFDAVYDERRSEEVLIAQHTTLSPHPVVWASFDKRSQQRGEAPGEPEDMSIFELTAYEPAGSLATLKLKLKREGERVLDIPVPSSAEILAVTVRTESADLSVPFLEGGFNIYVILPSAPKSGADLQLQLTYSTAAPPTSGLPLIRPDAIIPETYRDQWIVDAIRNYVNIGSGLLAVARSQLLEESPQGVAYDSLAPIGVGFRMTQLSTTAAGSAALRNKSVWVLHMLRMLMRRGDGDAFGEMVVELRRQFGGRTISTAEFRQLVEKHVGQDLGWFFEQWVDGTGIPNYAVTSRVVDAPDGFVVEGRIDQSGVPESFTMPVPVFADDVFLGNVTVSGDEGEFRFVTKTKPATIRIDPNESILAVIGKP